MCMLMLTSEPIIYKYTKMVLTVDYKRSYSPVFHGIPTLNCNQFQGFNGQLYEEKDTFADIFLELL